MNRYAITNLRTGNKFQVEATTLPPRQPEWGKPAGRIRKELADAWELTNGTEEIEEVPPAKEGDEPAEIIWINYPDSMQVVTTNIDAEVTADNQKKTQANNAMQRIINFNPQTATAAEKDQLLVDLRRAVIFFFRNL